jgi:transcription initiation factor TFIIH subunit 4
MQITSAGFQFLLHPPGTQLWQLLAMYLGMAQVRLPSLLIYAPEYLGMTGEENGFSRSSLFSLHVEYYGARSGLPVLLMSHCYFSFPECRFSSLQEYSAENLSATQKAMLEDLRDYGLIWQRKVPRTLPLSLIGTLEISISSPQSLPRVVFRRHA